MKPSVLFISNEIYFDYTKQEGGVRVCTEEYLTLLKHNFDIEIFKVSYHYSFAYRMRVKLGINIYNDYKIEKYTTDISDLIKQRNISFVFLNLSNTAPFAKIIKKAFGDRVKVVLCSHGNESGDYLHTFTRFKDDQPFYRSFFSSIALGRLMKKESYFRQELLDAVLTVSPVEESLEKWLGAKHVLMVPRTVNKRFLSRKIIKGRFGFIGDLTHSPNLYGIEQVCNAIQTLSSYEGIDIRIVGSPSVIGKQLSSKYPFVTFLGYLDNESFEHEASTWSFFINPVFYYSRGVSTKLAKALGWGLPVITTTIGYRGYLFNTGSLVIAESADEMARKIGDFSIDESRIQKASESILELIASLPEDSDNARKLNIFLHKL